MNSDDWVLGVVWNGDFGSAIRVDSDGLASTSGADFVARDDIAVFAGWQTSLEGLIQAVVLVVDGDEGFLATRERDLMVAVVPPVGDRFEAGYVSETGHVVDLAPSVLADPSTTTGVVTIETNRRFI